MEPIETDFRPENKHLQWKKHCERKVEMKQKRFVSMIGALVVILGAVAFITGCPQANSNKDKAVYVNKTEANGVTYTNIITFKTDGTWMQRTVGQGRDAVVQQGTYTGDPSKDGTVTITITKQLNTTGSLVDVENPQSTDITVTDGKFSIGTTEFTRQ